MITSLAIPEELIEQLERGNVVPLLGPDLSQGQNNEKGLPSLLELSQELARRSGYTDNSLAFSQVAQHYEIEQERQALISFLRERLTNINVQPLSIHRLLATHPWSFVLTTALDDLFERALADARHPYTGIVDNIDVAFEDQDKLILVKMYGSLDQPDSVVVTELDYLRWQGQVENIMDLLKGLIASRTLLILGHDLEDEHLRNLYGWVTLPFKRNVRRSYAVALSVSAYTTALWKKLGVEIIRGEPIVFVEKLLKQAQPRRGSSGNRPAKTLQVPLTPIPRQPYKFLNSYEESDTSIFFGRDKEKAHILSKIVSFRLILLHGKSGTGKSSLIKAGLIPALRERGYLVTYARSLLNPVESIQRAFNETVEETLPSDNSLHSFLTKAVTISKGTHVLFLDQFEELFVELYDAGIRQEFLNALGEIYADTSLDLKLVLAIREDALAELSILKGKIPEIFYNDYHLELFTADQARQAIVNPVRPYGIHYEEGLVDQILIDLGGDNVDPPQLQIVCDHLYKEREDHDQQISYTLYDRLGGARAILAEYLNKVLNQYPGPKRLILQAVLKEFVTSSGRQAIPTHNALVEHTGLSLLEIEQAVDELEEARLIRELHPEPRFELVHEYLIPQISSWTSEEDRAQKRAQEMLEQGFVRWQNFHLPLYTDELIIINQQREKLHINKEIYFFIIYSSVWTGSDAEYWLGQATHEQRLQTIKAAFEDTRIDRRARAALLAGNFSVTELIPPLKQVVEEDSDAVLRRQAINSLLKLLGVAVTPWLTTLLHGSPLQQQHALEAIDEIQYATDWDLGMMQDFSRSRLRLRIRLLRWRRHRRQWELSTVYAALCGALGGFLGGSLAAILNQDLSGFVVSSVLGSTFGFLAGAGVGFGYGSVLATEEPRRSLLYVLGAAIGGSMMGLLATSADLLPEKIIWSMPIGILSGAITGAAMAILINLTSRFPGRIRLILRLVVGTLLGIITTGLLLSVGTQVGRVDGGLPVVPLLPMGALLVGALSVAGIAAGLEWAERGLEASSPINSIYQAT
jgi:hypothetical protein